MIREALIATITAILLAVPWIYTELVWCGWIGTALALFMATTWIGKAKYGWVAYAIVLALVVAFHWAPNSMANQMGTGYLAGLVAFVPLLALDAFRAAVPLWFVSRVGTPSTVAWLPAGCCAALCEALLPTVFPWRWGYMQAAWPWTVQSADLLGTPGLTLLTFAHAGVLIVIVASVRTWWLNATRSQPSPVRIGAIGWLSGVLCVLNGIYGWYALRHWQSVAAQSPKLAVAMVQVEPGFSSSMPTLQRLTQQVAKQVDLVCWPESSAGCYSAALPGFSNPEQIFEQSRDPDRGLRPWPSPSCTLLTGATIYEGDRERPAAIYQSAILIDPKERLSGIYRKRHLMPFGEYVPGENWVPGLKAIFAGEDTLSCGDRASVPSVDGKVRIGILLCYEDMLPSAAASMTAGGANLLVALINASAFDAELPRHQHRLLAQLRAVENRRSFLRCAATGETCVISPWGTIEQRLPLHGDGVLTAEVALLDNRTWAEPGSFVLTICCGLALIWFWRRQRMELSD